MSRGEEGREDCSKHGIILDLGPVVNGRAEGRPVGLEQGEQEGWGAQRPGTGHPGDHVRGPGLILRAVGNHSF